MLNYGDSNRVWLNVIATLTFTHLYSLFYCVRSGISTGVEEEITTFFSFTLFFFLVDGDKANNAYKCCDFGQGLEWNYWVGKFKKFKNF